MGLVDYSDSESDTERLALPPAPHPKPARPAFQKSEAGKIKVELPTLKPETATPDPDGPPAKRVRTAGAFSGFNSLLPAPKRVAQNKPKPGVNLKTSGEAAFSRAPATAPTTLDESITPFASSENALPPLPHQAPSTEPKLVGKTTKFVPLSVAQKKKKKPVNKAVKATEVPAAMTPGQKGELAKPAALANIREADSKSKSKNPLFVIPQAETTQEASSNGGTYEPLMTKEPASSLPSDTPQEPAVSSTQIFAHPDSLEAVAADLNLTPAQRRQLFGRKGQDAQVAHFNLDSEYAMNERLRQAGETVEHRAIKTIAPGKHSLQQLMNNAKSQKDAMEDAWAQGWRNRGEGGSKYGWGSG